MTSPEMSAQGASSMPLVEADVHALISMSRSSRVLSLSANAAESDMSALMEEFAFVPLLVLAMLASIIPDARRLRRLLHQDWVRSWNGWRNANCLLDDSSDDATSETIASDIIQDFSRISLQNVDIVAKTDAVRRREVEAEGKHIGVGLVHGNNECCADSLLQLLSHNGFASSLFMQNSDARRKACQALRAHLLHHSNPQLHPRQRTSTGEVADVSDAEHARAFLQHDVHAEEIITTFVEQFPGSLPIPPEGLLLRVYTRWDSPTLPVESNSLVVARNIMADVSGLAEPSVAMELYNNTGNGFTGYHYDPVFSRDATPNRNEEDIGEHSMDVPPPPPPHDANRPRKRSRLSGKQAEETDAHDQCKPTQPSTAFKSVEPSVLHFQQLSGIEVFTTSCLEESPDPRRTREVAIEKLSEELRHDVTIPADSSDPNKPWATALLDDVAVQLPPKHCAFRNCAWVGEHQVQLEKHLLLCHRSSLDKVATLFHNSFTVQERLNGAYNCALSVKVQDSAPLASYSVDRRCLYAYTTSLADDKLDSLICFACARRFPYVSSFRRNEINWIYLQQQNSLFMGMGATTLENILGFRTYLKNMVVVKARECQI